MKDDLLRHCDEALTAMGDMVAGLGDDLANRRPDLPGANSPYAILTHCLGVCAYWASTVNLGQVVPRDRDAEFTATGPVADLAARTEDLRSDLAGWFGAAQTDQPPANPPHGHGDDRHRAIVSTQGSVLLHVYEELAQHRGQMEITRDLLVAGSGERPPLP